MQTEKRFLLGGHLIQKSVQSVDIPIIGSINGITNEGWIDFARKIQEAGGTGWTCRSTEGRMTCTRTSIPARTSASNSRVPSLSMRS